MTKNEMLARMLLLAACAILVVAANPIVIGGSMSTAPSTSCVPDAYEPDDAPWQAKPLGGWHTFHTESDTDWMQFEAEAGTTYSITTEGSVSYSDKMGFLMAALELYDRDGTTSLRTEDFFNLRTYRPSTGIYWRAPASGTYFVKMTPHPKGFFECDVPYWIAIEPHSMEPTSGKIIGTVWEDLDWGGDRQSDETGIEGIPVTLEGIDTSLVLTTVTDSRGYFVFDGVPSGYYFLIRNALPGYIPTTGTESSCQQPYIISIYPSRNRRLYACGLYPLVKELPRCCCSYLPLLQH